MAQPLRLQKEELTGVKLYQTEYSPPCVKIRAFLKYHGVPFETVFGRHPTSDYKQFPVLELNGRQINDSHIIMTSLAPVLMGRSFTEEEQMWEKKFTYEFMPAFEVELAGDANDIANLTGFVGGWKRWLIGLVTPLLGAFLEQVFKARYPDMKLPSSLYGVQFKQAMGSQPFFHGEQPGPVDLSLYGTYAAFAEKRCRSVARFLQDSQLEEWHERMVALVPEVLDR